MWFLFGELSSFSWCLGWAALFYCGTPWAFHIIILNIRKASGPDGLSARMLKECSSEIAPTQALIYNESLAPGDVPDMRESRKFSQGGPT